MEGKDSVLDINFDPTDGGPHGDSVAMVGDDIEDIEQKILHNVYTRRASRVTKKNYCQVQRADTGDLSVSLEQ